MSSYRPVFLFVFSNGVRSGGVRPDVALCEMHRRDLVERFRSRKWQREFDLSLPPSSAPIDWSLSRLAFEAPPGAAT